MPQTAPANVQRRHRVSPAVALAVLAVVIAEVLSGSTHLSTLFAVIPEILVWGCGALLIREAACRRNLSGTALVLMGIALSLAEEILIQQTSLAPLPRLKGAAQSYGRAVGVNWIYLLFQLGYESVWVVVVPVQLVELIFAERRSEAWLRRRGLIVTAILFLLGARMAWYGWMKRVRPMIFHLPPYHPSPYAFLTGMVAMIGLVSVALTLRRLPQAAARRVPPPALFFIVLAMGWAWYLLLVLQFSGRAALIRLPLWIAITGGLAWGGFVFLLLRRWAYAAKWTDMHRYSAVFAAVVACMTGGWLGAGAWLRMDKVAQVAFDLAAIILMAVLGRSLTKRAAERALA
jgi:hypothetical protein